MTTPLTDAVARVLRVYDDVRGIMPPARGLAEALEELRAAAIALGISEEPTRRVRRSPSVQGLPAVGAGVEHFKNAQHELEKKDGEK